MGERPDSIHVFGSPAVDGLADIPDLPDDRWEEFGRPRFVILHHPIGDSDEVEYERSRRIISLVARRGRTLLFAPNHDPGSDGIRVAIEQSGLPNVDHLDRGSFIGLLKRASVLVGNSSAGLLECAALGTPAVDIGSRQSGRERPDTSVHVPELTGHDLDEALVHAQSLVGRGIDARFGTGEAGPLISRFLAEAPLPDVPLRKSWFECSAG